MLHLGQATCSSVPRKDERIKKQQHKEAVKKEQNVIAQILDMSYLPSGNSNFLFFFFKI